MPKITQLLSAWCKIIAEVYIIPKSHISSRKNSGGNLSSPQGCPLVLSKHSLPDYSGISSLG